MNINNNNCKPLLFTGANERLTYIGKEKDRESGLGDHGVCKYDYKIGRFTTIDPMWAEYRGFNPYQYCGNNPINSVDRNGKNYHINITVKVKISILVLRFLFILMVLMEIKKLQILLIKLKLMVVILNLMLKQ